MAYNPNGGDYTEYGGGGGGGGGGAGANPNPAPAGPADPWAGYTFTPEMAQAYYNTLTPEQKAQVDAIGGPSPEWLKNAVAAGVPQAIRAAGGTAGGAGGRNNENEGGEAGYTLPWQNALEPEAWLGKRNPTVPELRKWAHYQNQAYNAGDPNAQDEDYERFSDRVVAELIRLTWDAAGGGWKPGGGNPWSTYDENGNVISGPGGPGGGRGGGGKRKPKPAPAAPAAPVEEPTGEGSTGTEAAPAPTPGPPPAETGGGVTYSAPPPEPPPGVTFSSAAPAPPPVAGGMPPPAPVPDVWANTPAPDSGGGATALRAGGGSGRNMFASPSFFGGQNRNNSGWSSGSGWVTSDERLKTKGLHGARFSDWRK